MGVSSVSMESAEPVEPSSSSDQVQNNSNPNTAVNGNGNGAANGDVKPSTSDVKPTVSDDVEVPTSEVVDEIQPREVNFDQFVETCKTELSDEANPPEIVTRQLTTLKEKYAASPIWKNKALSQILSHFDWTLRLETDFSAKSLLLHDFKEEFKRLDAYLTTLKSKDKKEQLKLMKKIKDIQTRIKKDLRKIDRLDQIEISIDDLDKEDSAHMKKLKYEQRVARFAVKLLALQGLKKTSFRIIDKVFKYTGTQYSAVNEAISTKYRAIMQKKYRGSVPVRPINSTPNIKDIIDIINNVSTEKKIAIPNVEDLAYKIAEDILGEVQKRRDLELQEMMNEYEHDSHLLPQSFPDLGDEELNKRLTSNEEMCRGNIKSLMDNFAVKLGEIAEEAEIGGDEPQSEEEDDEEEDPMDGLDEDEEISDDGEDADETVENVLEDDDDDPVILEEPSSTQNDDDSITDTFAAQSSDGKKRSVDPDSTNSYQLKKLKTEESEDLKDSCDTKIVAEGVDEKVGPRMEEVLSSKETKESEISEVSEGPKVPEIEMSSDKTKEETEPKDNNVLDVDPSENSNSSNVVSSKEEKTDEQSATRSESEDSIKIVDLEAESRIDELSNFNEDMVDDDDVICLD